MAVFEWDGRYATNIPEIDNDHRQLVEVINESFAVMEQGGPGIYDVLAKLRHYAEGHFRREAEYMEASKYPDRARHLQAHADFIRKLVKFEMGHAENPLTLSIKVSMFLNEWLQDHLLGEDRKLFQHVGSIPPPRA
jgi:hemerythrin-like metal-binding protein